MKFRCDRDLLSEALQTVQRGVSTRPGIPALTGVLMTVGDSELALTTTDLEVTTEVRVGVDAREDGNALVPARLLADMVKALPPDAVDFETDGSQAKVSCRSFEGTLRCLAAEDFPAVRDVDGVKVTVDATAFAEGVAQVARAASRDEARPVLTGVLMEANREGLILVATDSYRLAVREVQATGDGEARALVPERAIAEAGRAAGGVEKGQVEVVIGDAQAAFRVGTLRMTSRLIEGEFPNYRQLLPEPGQNRLSTGRTELLEAVRRVGLLARESSPVRLELNALGVRLTSSSPDLGGAVEAVEGAYEGEDLTVAFNPGYLGDGLSAPTSEKVTVELRDGLKPALVRGEGEDAFTYLVMPVRLPAPVG
ncbi:MAG TPA: DNA polymerase III subunit beta [Actinomycetota bacterium]|nr:DNA polymerase III subunit beta [Actinomycetota bacterium]